MLQIKNLKSSIISTNYWSTDYAMYGYYFLSINAGAFRLLVPDQHIKVIKEFATAEYCIISKGPAIAPASDFTLELLFEGHTQTPYMLCLSSEQVDRVPGKTDEGRCFPLTIWKNPCQKVIEMDAYFRVVNRIPYLEPINSFKKGA